MVDPTPAAGSAGDQGEAYDRKVVTALNLLANRSESGTLFKALHLIGRLYDRLAASEARAQAAEADRDAGAGKHPSGLTWAESVDLLSQVAGETADELGCERDNEAVLMAIHDLRERAQAAEARLRTLEALIEPMREALEPFAAVTGYACLKDDAEADVDFLRRIPYRNRRNFAVIRVRDLRRARAQLAALPTTDKDASHG